MYTFSWFRRTFLSLDQFCIFCLSFPEANRLCEWLCEWDKAQSSRGLSPRYLHESQGLVVQYCPHSSCISFPTNVGGFCPVNPTPAVGNSLRARSLQCRSTQSQEILGSKEIVCQKLQFIFAPKLFTDLSWMHLTIATGNTFGRE